MTRMRSRSLNRLVVAAALALGPAWALSLAQSPARYNERDIKPEINVEDKGRINVQEKNGIWVLDFRFKDPRMLTVDIPGRGRTLCWYLWYQIINNTGKPRTFIPDFELVTTDRPGGVYHDQVLPKVQEAIRQIEDPTKHLDIKNSVTIAEQPIPVSPPDAFPKAVTGVAIWTDVDQDASRFSVFVSGLSNGWSLAEIPPNNQTVVRRKTLQLNFKRAGQGAFQDSREVRFVAPATWLYRGSWQAPASAPKPGVEPAEKPATEKEKAGAAFRPPSNPFVSVPGIPER